MQTTNFVKKAVIDLKATQMLWGSYGCHKTARLAYYMQEWMQQNPKFMLPEGGVYYDNKTEFDQVDADLLRLPFPVMSVEYRAKPQSDFQSLHGEQYSSKRINLLIEVDYNDYEKLALMKKTLFTSLLGTEYIKSSGFIILNVSYADAYKKWDLKPHGAFVAYGQELLKYKDPNTGEERLGFNCVPLLFDMEGNEMVRAACIKAYHEFGGAERAVRMDILEELVPIAQLCSMLNCSNVEIEKISSRRKPKTKKGCLPFDEYHVLKIAHRNNSTTPEKQSESADKRSYRTHLRRGHIRRIASGYTWVSSCVVNPHQSNTVYKDYLI